METSALWSLGATIKWKGDQGMSDDGAKLPQRTSLTNRGIGPLTASIEGLPARGLRSAVVMVGGRPVVGLVGACEN
jgi:hypothetical protein